MAPTQELDIKPRSRGSIGVLQDGEKYLLVRRAPDIVMGGSWCFPGGHVEVGENSRAAIVRELREELGIDIVPGRRLGSVRVSTGPYVLVTWLIQYDGARLVPNPAEIAATDWLTISEIRTKPGGLRTNEQVLRMLE